MEKKHVETILIELDRRLRDIAEVTEEKGQGDYYQSIIDAMGAVMKVGMDLESPSDIINRLKEKI